MRARIFLFLYFFLFFSPFLRSQCDSQSTIFTFSGEQGENFRATSIRKHENFYSICGELISNGESDYFLLELDENFSVLNSLKIGSDFEDSGRPPVHERFDNGSYVIVGFSQSGIQRRGEIVCFNQDQILWQKRIEGTFETPRATHLRENGNLVVAGSSESFSNGSSDAFLTEIDPDGNILFKIGTGNADNEHYYEVNSDFAGNLLTLGNNASFSGNHRPVLATFDDAGDILSYNIYTGSGTANFSSLAKTDQYYIVGGLIQQGFNQGGLLAALDSDFEVVWSRVASIEGQSDVGFAELTLDQNGNLIATYVGGGSDEKYLFLNVNPENGILNSVASSTNDVLDHESIIVGEFQAEGVEEGVLSIAETSNSTGFILFSLNPCFSNGNCIEEAFIDWSPTNLTKEPFNPGERILQDVFDINEFTVSTATIPLAEPCGLVCQGELLLEDLTVCVNEEVNLSYQLNNESSPIASWSWDFGNGDASDTEMPITSYGETGTYQYSLELYTNAGCEYLASGNIEVLTQLESPGIDNQIMLCPGETFEMNTSDYPGWQIFDSEGNLITEFTTQSPGVYTFDFMSDCGQETVEIEVQNVNLGFPVFDDVTVCTDETVTANIEDFEIQFPDADLIVDDGSDSPENFTGFFSTVYQTAGTYSVILSGTIQGCEVNESFDVFVENPITSFLENEFEFCSNQTFELNFENLNHNVFDADGNLVTSMEIQESGTYVFNGENGCSEFTEIVQVNVIPFNPEPLPQFQTICPDRDTAAIGFLNNNYLYQWENGSEDSLMNVTIGGSYEILVSDASEQCSEHFLFQVSENPYQPVNIFESPRIDICLEGQNTVTFPSQLAPYTAMDGSEIPLKYEAKETEMLYFSYGDGCYTYNDSVFLSVESCLCPVYVPNGFTPNEDGMNDLFRPSLDCPVYDYRMVIFNRLGKEVFESNQIDIPWKGESIGKDYYAQSGVYVYLIRFSQELDGLRYPTELRGTVTLLR